MCRTFNIFQIYQYFTIYKCYFLLKFVQYSGISYITLFKIRRYQIPFYAGKGTWYRPLLKGLHVFASLETLNTKNISDLISQWNLVFYTSIISFKCFEKFFLWFVIIWNSKMVAFCLHAIKINTILINILMLLYQGVLW